MFDFIGEKISGIDVTKEVVSSKKRTTLLSLRSLDAVISDRPVRKPLLIFPTEDDAKFFALRARTHPSKEEERLHVPSILRLQAASPINADTGAHHTTSPSYANYEPPWELNVRLFCVHPYTEQVEKQHERAKCESSARARLHANNKTKETKKKSRKVW